MAPSNGFDRILTRDGPCANTILAEHEYMRYARTDRHTSAVQTLISLVIFVKRYLPSGDLRTIVKGQDTKEGKGLLTKRLVQRTL